jgi:hypothetical protein
VKNLTEILQWKYPGCQFSYQGDGTHIEAQTMPNGDYATGLNWMGKDIPQPTKADIESWEAEWEEDTKWAEIRAQRDRLLAETDYLYLTDAPSHGKKSEMTTYRQALRDLPQSAAKAEDVKWPKRPE